MRTTKRILLILSALVLVPIWTQAKVAVDEGRVPNSAPQPLDATRSSRYSSAAAGAMPEAKTTDRKQASAVPQLVYRSSTLKSPRAAYFSIYDADRTLITDRDRDGQFSEFKIRFDADVSVGETLVYAKMYIRRVGGGSWQLYHTTSDFWIDGQSDSDDYYVTTTLKNGFPSGDYDVLIDLYESGYDGIVATLAAYDTATLGYLPLEEVGLDVPFGLAGYAIHDVVTTFLIDDDRDGYSSKFRVTFDPDSDYSGDYAYAVVWVRPQGGEWIKEHTSNDFPVDVSGTADSYSFTADWISGYPTANYDVQIDLYDAASDLLAASAGSERPELSLLPLEDATRDRPVPPPPSSGGSIVVVTTDEQGGGAVSVWLAIMLATLAIGRKLRSVKRLRAAVVQRAQRR